MSKSIKLGKFKEVTYPGESPGIDWLNTFVKYTCGFSILLVLSIWVMVVGSFRYLLDPLNVDLGESFYKVWRPVLKGESLAHIFRGR